jgi:hypothetical protein
MDDNSNLFANAVAIRGVTSLAAGQSVVFIENGTDSSKDAALLTSFETAWFGSASNAPAGFTVNFYGGSGVGLGQTSDAVNIFDSTGTLVTRVDFGASTPASGTFDNAAGLNNVTLTQYSVVGVNGAFKSADGTEVGSPGTVSAVPEPGTLLSILAAGLFGLVVRAWRRRK